ncbi:aldo/keto reductase [Rubellimicrobium rubrum]|uniref:Aldo/keto reductase n=1 Tax=Rubellimicrobium rubrum TaxID=2585369 RepID=A0A5C4MXM1_9RHOB|nr:aldo/keto reductase [Rubellimicrobium rubrum]TNC49369.1 aldo/keto reductase [Rubellimicrobium rubrum]
MRQVELGRSGIRVSEWALGTMTFGNQTPEDDAHRQMDMALEAGVTLWDCAEMYPVNPVTKESAGRSEAFLGRWFASHGRRAEVVLATKVAGPRNAIRGDQGFGNGTVKAACEASLKRLQTEVIDLYQLHWPERAHYHFRRNWTYDPSSQDKAANIALMDDVLGQLSDLRAEGKIREFGLSNETAWGTVRWMDRAEALGAPMVRTVQNEYSLLARLYDTDMAEVAVNEGVTLLAFSPLGAGLLTGKYAGGALPEGSRKALNGDLGGRASPRVDGAVAAYHAVAQEAGLDPVHMAMAWHRTRPFPSIPIFGATTVAQLERILAGVAVEMGPDLAKRIDEVNRAQPLPY